MFHMPKEFFDVESYEVYWSHITADLKLPLNPLHIASNMASLMSGETYVIVLKNDGTFDRTESLDEYEGAVNKISMLREAEFHGWPIKVEDMENYNETMREMTDHLADGFGAPMNAHLFIGFEGRGSFGWHSDEGVVACYMVSGTKRMETRAGNFDLEAGDWLVMPEGLEHCATNLSDTVMISFGSGSHRPARKTEKLWHTQPYLLQGRYA